MILNDRGTRFSSSSVVGLGSVTDSNRFARVAGQHNYVPDWK